MQNVIALHATRSGQHCCQQNIIHKLLSLSLCVRGDIGKRMVYSNAVSKVQSIWEYVYVLYVCIYVYVYDIIQTTE